MLRYFSKKDFEACQLGILKKLSDTRRSTNMAHLWRVPGRWGFLKGLHAMLVGGGYAFLCLSLLLFVFVSQTG